MAKSSNTTKGTGTPSRVRRLPDTNQKPRTRAIRLATRDPRRRSR
jgi:hypothetical protein